MNRESKAKHTQGKWSVSAHSKTNENGAEYLTIDCFENGSGVEGLAVVYEGVHGDPRAEMEANAHLIAASPEMYDALRKVNNFISANMGKNYMVALMNREVPEIKELIKKIEG